MKKNKEEKKISLKDKLFKTIVSNKILSVVIISIVTLLIAGTTTLIIVNRIKLKTIKNTTVEEKTKEVKHTLTLNLKEVSVEEGTEYKITDFIDSILRDDVKLVITEKDGKYLVSEEVIASETTENDANESTDDAVEPKYLEDELVLTYESEDMASITEVGEHTIKVKATLGKIEAEAEAKLTITAKPEKTASISSGGGITSVISSSYSSNPIVQKALSLVGDTNKTCDNVVATSISVAGYDYYNSGCKLVTIEQYCSYFNKFECVNSLNSIMGDKVYEEDNTQIGLEFCRQYNIPCYSKYRYIFKDNIFIKLEGYNIDTNVWEEDKYVASRPQHYYEDKSYSYKDCKSIIASDQVYQVSLNAIQPGDILFYENGGRGRGHVALYIGNGQAVNGGVGNNNDVQILPIYISGASTPIAYRLK